MAKPRYDPSLDRQRLSILLQELSHIVGAFCEHDPVFRGSFEILRRRCGHPRCRCANGQLHETHVLLDRSSRRRRSYKSTPKLRRYIRKPLREYRRLRLLRMRLRKLHREFLQACDRLREARIRQGADLLPRFKE